MKPEDSKPSKPGMVPVYDPQDGTTTSMPARELASGMMTVEGPGINGRAFVNARELASTLSPSPIIHPPLDAQHKELMQALSEDLWEVNPKSAEEWELGFRKDAHMENEMSMWATLALTYTTLVEERVDPARPHNMRQKQKRDYYHVLLQCICVPRENVLQTVRPLEIITTEEAAEVVDFFYNIDRHHNLPDYFDRAE